MKPQKVIQLNYYLYLQMPSKYKFLEAVNIV